jgi:hypothetical protein
MFNSKPEAVKIKAASNFLDSLNNLENIKVTEQEPLKVNELSLPKAEEQVQQNKEIPSYDQLKVSVTDGFLDSMEVIFRHHLHNF